MEKNKLSNNPIFQENHLNYVISNRDTLRGYMAEALEIDRDFLDKFQVSEWITALEVTLHYRPKHILTEDYLKSQRLWIMHKLLMTLGGGIRERMQLLLQQNGPGYESQLRGVLFNMLRQAESRIGQTNAPILNISEDLIQGLTNFLHTNQTILMQEKTQYVHRRCEIIQWFSILVINNNEKWLQSCLLDELYYQFKIWIQNSQMQK